MVGNQEWGCEVDTYIEEQFRLKSQKTELGNKLWSDWVYNKNQYEERTKTTIYEFMNYSRHDASHSVNILRAIERILSKERVGLLGIGDLWILLNAAYAHDIGMSTEYCELQELWKEEEFLTYISKEQESTNSDIRRAARHYTWLDAFVRRQRNCGAEMPEENVDFEWEDFDSWPLEFRKEITSLMSEYIRKKHGERSRAYFNKWDRNGNIIFNDRLYGALGQIVALHTRNQEDIKELRPRCDGFEDDHVHPQFLAVLLRVGDLLDLDNNRFDVFAMKHFGKLPRISVAHYKKHQSVEHLLITPEKIEVVTNSDDFEVCKISLMWFDDLKREIINMITRWQEIAPSELQGCLMGIPDLTVLHKNRLFSSEFARDFELDRRKLMELFVGNNLYDSDLDFIREYVQNSFDALRIMLWNDLDQEFKREKYLIDSKILKEELKPIDFKKEAYDNYPVIIRICECKDKQGLIDETRFVMEIEDNGIGIDENGINSISHIGTGWRERTNFTSTIKRMRQWLRPTGGFGIGMQSAFLVTDKVEIYTKAQDNPAYKITVLQDGAPNNILVEYGQQKLAQGTRIHLVIKFSEIIKDSILKKYNESEEWKKLDLFSYEDRLSIIWEIVLSYVKEHFKNSLFPIKVVLDIRKGQRVDTVQSKYFFSGKEWGEKSVPQYKDYAEIIHVSEESNSSLPGLTEECEVLSVFIKAVRECKGVVEDLYMDFDMDKATLRLWDDMTETFYYLSFVEETTVKFMANYKNVSVLKNSREFTNDGWAENPYLTNILLDVMGKKVEECLLVSRNQFKDEALERQFSIDGYIRAYFKTGLYLMEKYNKTMKAGILFLIAQICNEIPAEIIYGNNNQAFVSEGIYVWEAKEDSDGLIWKRVYYLYESLFAGLYNGNIILAIPEEEEKINYIIDERSEEYRELEKQILVIDDEKAKTVLRHYLNENSSIVLKLAKSTIDKKGIYSFSAFRILNKDESDIPGIAKREEGRDMSFDTGERHYTRVVKAKLGQEALLVQRLPFIPEDGGIYIISPFNAMINAEINRVKQSMTGTHYAHTKFTVQEYIEIVQRDPSFERLCKWVFENQKEQGKYSLKEIKEAYRRLLMDKHKEEFVSGTKQHR